VGGVGVVGLVCRQAGGPFQSFIRNGAVQSQESRQRQHDRQKVGAGRDSVKRCRACGGDAGRGGVASGVGVIFLNA